MAEGSVTGRKRRRWVPWALVAGFLALQTTAAWAEPVRVRAALHDDFGRVVFSWSSFVSHKSVLRNGRLTVRFGRPIEASFGRVARSLGKYIASVTPGDDGQSVVFDLKGDFDAYSYDSGRAVIVEFADKSPSAADKPEAEKKAEAKPETAAPSDPEGASGASRICRLFACARAGIPITPASFSIGLARLRIPSNKLAVSPRSPSSAPPGSTLDGYGRAGSPILAASGRGPAPIASR